MNNTSTEIFSKNEFFDSIIQIINPIVDISFVLLPALGYIHQFMKIRRLKNADGFSKFISFILVVAMIFRIFYWVGERFSKVFLFQSILLIIVQIILLKECIKYTSYYKNKTDSDYFNIREFWDWPFFEDYTYLIIFLSIFINLISVIIGYDNELYVSTLGTISATVEAMLGIPQVIKNYKTKNVTTISYPLILSWALGDFAKISFCIVKDAPLQLILCSVAQFCVDIIIIAQIFYYTKIYKHFVEEAGENVQNI